MNPHHSIIPKMKIHKLTEIYGIKRGIIYHKYITLFSTEFQSIFYVLYLYVPTIQTIIKFYAIKCVFYGQLYVLL